MPGDNHSEDGAGALDYGDVIDQQIFEQILEMDDDDDNEFSKQIVMDFFEQAKQTFEEMDYLLQQSDLPKLSDRGHFLKGSSATLGLQKVKDLCEKIQNWGSGKDETGDRPLNEDQCLQNIRRTLPTVKYECERAQHRLFAFYGESIAEEE